MKILILLAAALPLWAQLPKPGGGSSGGGGGGGTLTDVTNKGTQGVSLVSGLNGTVAEIFGLASLHPCQTVAINGATFTVDLNIVPANCELQNFGGLLRLTQIHTSDLSYASGSKIAVTSGTHTAGRMVVYDAFGQLIPTDVQWPGTGLGLIAPGGYDTPDGAATIITFKDDDHSQTVTLEAPANLTANQRLRLAANMVPGAATVMKIGAQVGGISEIGPAAPGTDFVAPGTATAYTAGAKQTMSHSATTAGLNVGPIAGNPSSPADGDIWYDDTAGKFKGRQEGATIELGGGAGTVPALLDTYANIAATTCNAANIGQLGFTTDGDHVGRCNGSAWTWSFRGRAVTPPWGESGSTQNNWDSTTTTATGGSIYFANPAGGSGWHSLLRSYTAPFTFTIAFTPNAKSTATAGTNACGIGITDNAAEGSKKFIWLHNENYNTGGDQNTVFVYKWTNHDTPSAQYGSNHYPRHSGNNDLVWLQIVDNNTNLIFNYSGDGSNWHQIHSVSRTDFLTPAMVAYGCKSDTSASGAMTVRHLTAP